MRIERLTLVDVEALTALDRIAQPHHSWPAAHFESALSQAASYQVWGIREDDELVGFAVLALQPFDGELEMIAVSPAQRRKGMGRRLLDHCIAQARNESKERVLLEVRSGNAEAVALYEQAGFIRDGRRRDYYPLADGKREDALLMSLRLV
ncbi:ribosomal protein S18-alanine N-acetyltransferase [Phytohalomonas tamaricis]|uniref:ribosomal protein S18-alanine N-acetyltransferase n=1 Tax=Phytohalomonas tamaricis TaxID=2081032 RepID=UPI000D0B472E|nr:ribosomal protein S18-alanine N-acetyltransferase [Phytohalomonas tamaricis]